MTHYDVIIVGAGPAGLSAALLLGRCRRSVLVCDTGEPRNAAARAVHGFFTRDGTPPTMLRQIGREQLRPYTTVELRDVTVTDAQRAGAGFAVELSDGSTATCRKLLLATGVVDYLPRVEGIDALYGRSVFHCPYCDGWEVADRPIAIYGRGALGRGLALELTAWSHDLVLCTDGPAELPADELAHLTRAGVLVREERVVRLEGTDNGMLERVVFATGDELPREALFFNVGQRQRSDLPARLGCAFTERGDVWTGRYESTTVSGLYVAGDASRLLQLVVVAAAEGAEAAFAINTALLKENLA